MVDITCNPQRRDDHAMFKKGRSFAADACHAKYSTRSTACLGDTPAMTLLQISFVDFMNCFKIDPLLQQMGSYGRREAAFFKPAQHQKMTDPM